MSTLQELAAEYERNIEIMLQRIDELEVQARAAQQLETRRKLRKRINTLHAMVNDSRLMAYQCAHYYDRPKEEKFVEPTPKRGRPRKYRRSGYGAPTPAAACRSSDTHRKTVSGIRSSLSRGHAAKRNCR